VTFADSVLHLVRAGARIDSAQGPGEAALPDAPSLSDAVAVEPARPDVSSVPARTSDEAGFLATELAAEAMAEGSQQLDEYQPGLGDLEAGVGLVSAGLATRVVLAGFPSWPGLLWRAYQLAESADVLIIPTVVRPGGKVDIVITREHATDG
jgi:hypothetical protein